MNVLKKVKFFFIRFLINKVFKGTHFFRTKVYLLRSIGVKVGLNTKIVGPLYFHSVVKLTIGDNCWIGRDFKIDGNGRVDIGNNCDIAPEVLVSTGSHKVGDGVRRAGLGKTLSSTIGDGCWIGTRTTIISGAKIENGVIVGASSLVNKICEKDSLYYGIPARKIKDLI